MVRVHGFEVRESRRRPEQIVAMPDRRIQHARDVSHSGGQTEGGVGTKVMSLAVTKAGFMPARGCSVETMHVH